MARNSSDREDLMAEAVTLVPRVQFSILTHPREIVAGQRADGRWSIFFEGDPVYQFDALHQLRRAFVDGLLYRTQGKTLARLTRQVTTEATVLLRHDLTSEELSGFFQRMRDDLTLVAQALQAGQIQLQQTIPEGTDFLPILAAGIDRVLNSNDVLAPAITKR